MVKRASPYLYYITNQVEARGMPMEIALLPAIESAYKPHALSRSKAAGIWQFIPSTGRHYGLKQNYWYDGRKDIVAATNAALNYLEKLNKDFKGDWALTLAAYNAGEGRVGREIKKNARRGKPINYTALTGLRLETRRYVPKLIAISNIIKNPQKYGLQVAVVPNQPYFSEIRLGSQIDLNIVADSSGVPIKELKMLNPGFKRWATDPAGPHRLLVPVDEAVVVADAIARIPQSQRMRWDYYTVRKGDSLNRIARKHHVSTASLRKSNKINGNLIHPGQNLLIPVSTSSNKARQYERTASKTTTRKTGTAANAASKPVTVSVRKGDTLWSLSRRYNVSLNELASWNQIDVNDLLHMGQKLKIWR
jgi:membrane-bound lytic murein transglycosylase D